MPHPVFVVQFAALSNPLFASKFGPSIGHPPPPSGRYRLPSLNRSSGVQSNGRNSTDFSASV